MSRTTLSIALAAALLTPVATAHAAVDTIGSDLSGTATTAVQHAEDTALVQLSGVAGPAVPTGGHSKGHQAIVVRGGGSDRRTLAFFGDLCMRPWSANPRWVTAFDDFPLDSVTRKVELFTQAVEEDWIVVLSHEANQPIGRLERDRDRFRFVPE